MIEPWMSGIIVARVPAGRSIWFSGASGPGPKAFQRCTAGRAVIFEDLAVVGVGDEERGGAAYRLALAAALPVIGVARHRGRSLLDAGQPVLGIVAVGEGAVEGQASIAVTGRRHRADHAV
jgi:hypothetical protein